MNDVTHALQEALAKQLNQSEFDVVGLIPIPAHGDRLVRMRTLQEMLEDLDNTNGQGMIGYFLQVKPKRSLQKAPAPEPSIATTPTPAKLQVENIYLPNGKLNVPYLFKNADLLFEAGDYPLAKNIYKTVLKSGENTSSALYRLARCYEAEGKFDEAKAHYEESIAYRPSIEAHQNLATLLIKQGKDQQAAEILERALVLKEIPQNIRFELLRTCGNSWTRCKRTEDAERNFRKALEIQPNADGIRSNLGALYLQANKIGEAKRHFRDALASNPKNHQALSGMGSCTLAEGDKRSAHDFFLQSLEIELNNPTAIYYLVKCAYEIKSYASAAKVLDEYVQIAPVNANLLYSLAGLQFHLGRIAEAKATALKIIELQPKHAGAKDLLMMVERHAASK